MTNSPHPPSETAPARARRSTPVAIGSVTIGGGRPIAVQSMTNTDTADPKATADQAIELAHAGSELVRITVNTPEAAKAVPEIVRIVEELFGQMPDRFAQSEAESLSVQRNVVCAGLVEEGVDPSEI